MHNPEHLPLSPASFQEQRAALRAYWLAGDIIGWPLPADTKQLEGCTIWVMAGNPHVEDGFVRAEHAIQLERGASVGDLPELQRRFPWLGSLVTFRSEKLREAAAQLFPLEPTLVVCRPDGRAVFAMGLQLFGALDDVTYYDGNDLGVSFDGNGHPVLKLWAPTARSVTLQLFSTSRGSAPVEKVPLSRNRHGVWVGQGDPSWKNRFYLYEIEVFFPTLLEWRRTLVTDPYSISVGMNSERSQIIDLRDSALFPKGWDRFRRPGPDRPEDVVLYELHVRDFSSQDSTCRPEYRGKFMAFTEHESHGMKHLACLAEAGLTHVHLLPSFDFATVIDDPEERHEPEIPEGLPADSPEPQAIVYKSRDKDSYNWGYDPLHYQTPEGSYSTAPDGPARVLEFRAMVQALGEAGLGVVMDSVFNHTYRFNDDEPAWFERVVPGYYYRTDWRGDLVSTAVGKSGDVATERLMVEKLMIDSVLHWVKNFKVQGFRFDLMAFHTRGNMLKLREKLSRLTLERDGIDGSRVYLYGEGWRFGSLDMILSSDCCCQLNVHGLGIGTFNDRIRDRLRGGDFRAESRTDQGVVTGLWYDDNGSAERTKVPGDREAQRHLLLEYLDTVRISMAGNLREYRMQDRSGRIVSGAEMDFNGQPTGYTARPCETINYVSAHDNYEIWDQIAAKAPFQRQERKPPTATVSERLRMQKLALGFVALSQGIPFFTAGSELLRSKSGDNNSYNSGDWFNRIDYSMTSNNWGVGLPPAAENSKEWAFWGPRLRDPYFKPSPADIRECSEFFKGLLRLRKGSPLFRLSSLPEIQKRVHFLETDYGPAQPPGLVCMALRDDFEDGAPLDPERSFLLVVFNVTLAPISFVHEQLKGRLLRRHRDWTELVEQRVVYSRFNPDEGSLVAPPQTIAVYEQSRNRRRGR